MTEKHIHTWNQYNNYGQLCCSTCDMTYVRFLREKTIIIDNNPLSIASYMEEFGEDAFEDEN